MTDSHVHLLCSQIHGEVDRSCGQSENTNISGHSVENGDIQSESEIGCISGGFVLCAHSVEKTIGKGLVMKEGRKHETLGLPVWSKDEAISGFT